MKIKMHDSLKRIKRMSRDDMLKHCVAFQELGRKMFSKHFSVSFMNRNTASMDGVI